MGDSRGSAYGATSGEDSGKAAPQPRSCRPPKAGSSRSQEMRKAIQLLDEVKESIINAYEIKTGLSRAKLSHLMDGETWMNAKKALELGFCDEILYQPETEAAPEDSFTFSRRAVTNSLMDKLKTRIPKPDNRVKATDLQKRLSLLYSAPCGL